MDIDDIFLMIETGQVDQIMLTDHELNCADNRGWTPLIYAAVIGDAGAMWSILRRDPEVFVLDTLGLMAYDYALMSESQLDERLLDTLRCKRADNIRGIALAPPQPA